MCKAKNILQAALYKVIVEKGINQISITPPKLIYHLSASNLVVSSKGKVFIKIKLSETFIYTEIS